MRTKKRVAYLNSQYPSLTHSFIEREVQAVRAEGIDVHTFTIRPASETGTLGQANASAARETYVLMPTLFLLLCSQAAALVQFPMGYFRALLLAQRISASGIAARTKSLGYSFQAARLAMECLRRGIDHIHVHMGNNGAAVALLATAICVRLSYSLSIHGSAEFFDVHRINLRAKVAGARFVRCVSHFCRAQVMAWSDRLSWGKTHLVPCGVDLARLTPVVPRKGPGPLRILNVGRLDSIKGVPVLIAACADLTRRGVDWRLELVGAGPLEAALTQQAAALGLRDRVTFAGPMSQEDVLGAYDRSDVLVVSSFMESLPVVLMEAMGKGMLVVATSVGGIAELVQHRVTGLLVPPADSAALATALQDISTRIGELDPMRRAARQAVWDAHNLARTGADMAELLKPCLSENAPGQPRQSSQAA